MVNKIREQSDMMTAATSKVISLYGKWAKKKGLNYNSLMVLYAMEGLEKCTQKDICDKWMLPKTTVSTILNEFQKLGYVELVKDKMDRREKIIKLTETGQVYSLSILTELHEIEDRAMQKIDEILCEQMVAGTVAFGDIFEQEIENE